jgi:DNA-binding GntR family transcriptional regulator
MIEVFRSKDCEGAERLARNHMIKCQSIILSVLEEEYEPSE